MGTSVLQGDLEEFPLPDVLTLLASTGKTGRLDLVTEGRHGRVELSHGQLTDASADAERLPLARRLLGLRAIDAVTWQRLVGDAEGPSTDLELARRLVAHDPPRAGLVRQLLEEQILGAVFDLSRSTDGTFRFGGAGDRASDATTALVEVGVDTVLADAQRRSEAWPELLERTGPGDAVVTVEIPEQPSVRLDADGWQLIALADGERTIDELCRCCGRGRFDTRRTLAAMLDAGVITISADGPVGADTALADQAVLAHLEGPLRARFVARPTGPESVEVADVPVTLDVAAHDFAVAAGPAFPGRELVAGGTRPADRRGRLEPDPAVDEDLVRRLIQGVEGRR